MYGVPCVGFLAGIFVLARYQGWSLERPLQTDNRAMRQAAKVKERKLSAGLGDRRLGPWLLNITLQYRGNLPYLSHQLVKLIGEDRLHPVRQSVIRIVVHFHH